MLATRRWRGVFVAAVPFTCACAREASVEAHAAEPVEARAGSEPRTAITVAEAKRSEPALALTPSRAPAPTLEVPADLSAFLALLDDSGDRPPRLRVAAADLQRLFTEPKDLGAAEPYAKHELLDLDGDSAREAVVAISGGWWGQWLRLCVFERAAEQWELRAALRVEDNCRALPALGVATCAGRHWLYASWSDGWGTGIGESVAGLFELSGGRLEMVLCTADSGWIAGWGNPIDIEYQSTDFELTNDADAILATLPMQISVSASERMAARLDLDFDARLVFRQGAPGERFELVAPSGRGEPSMSLIMGLAEEAWLARHTIEADRLAREGTRDQQRLLRLLVDSILERGTSPEARTLNALVPPPAALESDGTSDGD